MERDFMGLNFNNSALALMEQALQGGPKDSGFGRSSEVVPRPFSDKNFPGSLKQDFFGGNHAAAPSVLPSRTSVAGTTDQRMNSKLSTVPPQLTIFYAGTVSVFDDISPEMAQAIMILAGNGFVSSNVANTKLDAKEPVSKITPAVDRSSGLPSPMSVSSLPIDASSVVAANNDDDVKPPSTIGMSTTLLNLVEPPRMVSSLGSVAATALMSSAVPQARKASLARFLEKRKERVMSAAPYGLSKKSSDSGTLDSTDVEFSASSGIGSTSVSTSKD